MRLIHALPERAADRARAHAERVKGQLVRVGQKRDGKELLGRRLRAE